MFDDDVVSVSGKLIIHLKFGIDTVAGDVVDKERRKTNNGETVEVRHNILILNYLHLIISTLRRTRLNLDCRCTINALCCLCLNDNVHDYMQRTPPLLCFVLATLIINQVFGNVYNN